MNTSLRILLLAAIVAIAGAACTSAGGGPSVPPLTDPGGGGGTGGGSGSSAGGSGGSGSSGGSVGSGGDSGTGIVVPVQPGPGGPVVPAQPKIVVPKPGRLDVHPVGASTIEAIVTGRHVTLRLSWWSGVEPCSVLDSVGVVRTGTNILLTIREGSDQRGVACIEIAMLKGTIVDLGELAPGTYTISAGGEAPPIQVIVS